MLDKSRKANAFTEENVGPLEEVHESDSKEVKQQKND